MRADAVWRRGWGLRVTLAVLALAGAFAGAAPPATAGAAGSGKLPAGFFGVVPQAAPTAADLTRMEGSVETLRIPIYWSRCEPRRGEYDFSGPDAEIAAAARHGIRVLPFVYGTPAWLSGKEARPPLSARALSAWKRFLRELVARYGPGGSLWRGTVPREPIRRWQIWNEPNFILFWAPRVSPRDYAKLLAASAATIRAADPGAQIVLAGIAPVGAGIRTWTFMRQLLRVPGVARDFDFAALHPYAATMPQMDYQLDRVRAAMAAGGAGRKPLIVTEIGVASGGFYGSAFVKGLTGQARFLRGAFARLVAMRHRWRIAGVNWFTWQDQPKPDPHCSFCQGAGLFTVAGERKPAWFAYRQAVRAARLQ